ncbi:MAG: ABC transporter permease [Crocinitomicaceae bacterium]|nr:ABC transporter permease [Crocinitomicaceae bacterium]
MRNSIIITKQELKNRIRSRFFWIMLVLGPILVLSSIYVLFKLGDQGKQKINVLVSDEKANLNSHFLSKDRENIHYKCRNNYVSLKDFKTKSEFAKYDALIDINPSILENKDVLVIYREKLSSQNKEKIKFDLDKRLEQFFAPSKKMDRNMIEHGMIKNFIYNGEKELKEEEIEKNDSIKKQIKKQWIHATTGITKKMKDNEFDWQFSFPLTISEYNSIKKDLGVTFIDINHPEGEPDYLPSWAGLGFSAVIFLFILLYGMSVLRSIANDKSTRIVEVILSSSKPSELLYGKIFGVGLAAVIQFFCWFGIIALGLFILKENWINSFYDPSSVLAGKSHLNELVELVYNRINYQVMIPYFLCFFILGYLFYSAFFSVIGASVGSENDGQQFIYPIVSILSLSLFIGYFSIYNPEHFLSKFCFYFPFTSPFVAMVKISNGISLVEVAGALGILFLSTILMIKISSRIYKNSILHYGHRLSLWQLIKWIRKA